MIVLYTCHFGRFEGQFRRTGVQEILGYSPADVFVPQFMGSSPDFELVMSQHGEQATSLKWFPYYYPVALFDRPREPPMC